ncbi:MAG: SAM-dependent methyltransferase [Deltaproteobacteria bacterium]|nr:SAM-dependent methyltransferase [Deltaproteobacteria bacterium]
MTSRLYACRPGRERVLADELARVLPASRHEVHGTGWVESRLASGDAAASPCLAFAAQCLPDPEPIQAPSVSATAQAAAQLVMERLSGHEGPWRFHVFCVETPGSTVRASRCGLVEKQVLDALRRRQKRLVATRVVVSARPWERDEILVQVALVEPRLAFFSVAGSAERERLKGCMSRFPGGVVEVSEDRAPPSRAYRKLLEVELRLGRRISSGETCVDLGASPGGWTHVALGRGARVIAVDRSPLRADLMAHPHLTFVRGDGFSFEPEDKPVDWLLSDIIAFPVRTIGLLERWLAKRWCRCFCVTIKFRGQDDYPELERLKAILVASGADFQLRELTNNKNEVTAFGELG